MSAKTFRAMFVAYWLVGCTLSGLAAGWWHERCGKWPTGVLMSVTLWPVAIFAAINSKPAPMTCEEGFV